jgi:hypothetical protein
VHARPCAGASFEELCADPAAAAWVVAELGAAAKADKLKGFERVAAVGGGARFEFDSERCEWSGDMDA